MQETKEQQDIIKTDPVPGQCLVIDALAGCAKTTTLQLYAKARPQETFLYLVFNSANRKEGREKMPSNVIVHTFHSLALSMMPHLQGRAGNNLPAFMTIKDIINKRAGNVSYKAIALAMKVFTHWCNSSSPTIKEVNILNVTPPNSITKRAIEKVRYLRDKSQQTAIYQQTIETEMLYMEDDAKKGAQALYEEMIDPDFKGTITHDLYLKLFQLEKFEVDFNYVVLDEGQDTNPVCAQIFKNQKHAKRIIVGDTHQAIYGWRGASDSIEGVKRNESNHIEKSLTRTFRSGDNLAKYAGNLLSAIKGETKVYRGAEFNTGIHSYPTDSVITSQYRGWTVLCRTNIDLWEKAYQAVQAGLKPKFVGGLGNYGLAEIEDMHDLIQNGSLKKFKPRTHKIRQFENPAQLETHCNMGIDQQDKLYYKAASSEEIWNKIQFIKGKESNQGDIVFTTAHRAKGLEWDHVCLSNDFPNFLEANPDHSIKLAEKCYNLKEAIIIAQKEVKSASGNRKRELENMIMEINLLYVSITRAKKQLLLPKYMHSFLETLQH